MSLTLETSIVFPVSAAVMLGILTLGADIGERTMLDIRTEYQSVLASGKNGRMFYAEIRSDPAKDLWCKSIAADPVMIRQATELLADTCGYLEGYLPFIREMAESACIDGISGGSGTNED